MVQNDDLEGLMAFCRRSSYDIIQPLLPDGWGPAWTFDGSNPTAAQRTAQMLRTLYGAQVRIRHARKIRYRSWDGVEIDAVLLRMLPNYFQVILGLEDGEPLITSVKVADESFDALRSALSG